MFAVFEIDLANEGDGSINFSIFNQKIMENIYFATRWEKK